MRKYLAGAVCCSILLLAGCSKDKTTNPSDTTSPSVTIVAPTNGATVGIGTVPIQAHATDNVGVTKVEFYDGATKIGEDATASTGNVYDVSWTSTAGSHLLKAIAWDAAGNKARDSITVTAGGTAGPTYHHGQIQQSETWYPIGNPHVITADVNVGDAANSPILTIMPGCIVQFQGDYELYCGYSASGAIVAEGKADSVIQFTTTSNPKTPGSWRSVAAYQYSTTATSLKYCTFEYGGSNSGMGALHVADVAVKINYCTVTYSGTSGITFLGSNGRPSQFTNNTVSHCAAHAIEIGAELVRTLGAGNTFLGNTNNDILVRGGIVSTTCTWLNQGAPYLATGEIGVEDATNSPTLTIAPGCVIKFANDDEFYCGYASSGAIVAEGTALLPIVFTTNTNPPTTGSWKAVKLYPHSTSATSFNYCTFAYGGSQEDNGGIYIENVATKLTNCTVNQSGHDGVYVSGTGHFSQFTGNTVSNCLGHAITIAPEYIRTLGSSNTYSGNTHNDIFAKGSSYVTTTGTWLNQGAPYLLAQDISIGDATNSPVLTIAPGTTIKAQSDVEFYVGYYAPGGLIADGTSGQITFTSSSTSPSAGDWKSVSFYNLAIDGSSKLKNCVIEYAGSNYGNVYVTDALPEITGCTIRHSLAWGIYLDGSVYPDAAALESNNTFSDNPSGNVRAPE